jgi:citrate lyase beta subunit
MAKELLERLRTRTEVNRAIGILQVWNACDRGRAVEHLRVDREYRGQARRMIAVVDAAADGRTDPDTRLD